MKKQQKRKKKAKNRPSSRPRPRHQRPRQARQSTGRVPESPEEDLAVACVAADALASIGLFVEAGKVLTGALTNPAGPNVRASEPYKMAEARMASLATFIARYYGDANAWEWLVEHVQSDLSRRLRLHIFVSLFEGYVDLLDLRELETVSKNSFPAGLPFDGPNRGGEIALRNLMADRRFMLGDLTGADHEWQVVGNLLARNRALDAGAARLLAANIALVKWRSGDAASAAATLAGAIRDNPVTPEQDIRSAYPVVCLAEMLRSSGDTAEAQALYATVADLYPPLESLLRQACGSHDDGNVEGEIESVRQGIDGMETGLAAHRTYYPTQTRLSSAASVGPARSARGVYGSGVEMYGSVPGIQAVDWCTPQELLMLHGPDDDLFLLSVRMTALAALREPNVMAVRQLRDVRRVLDERYLTSQLSEEVRRVEDAGLALIAVAGRL